MTEQECLDCNGDAFGNAYYDDCEQCVGGNTGIEACVQDCHGDWGGEAFYDACNNCAGGNTGLTPVTEPEACQATALDNQAMEKMIVFPNPTTGKVNIPVEASFSVYNAQGEMILTSSGTSLDLSTYPAGIYSLVLHGQVLKIIKE